MKLLNKQHHCLLLSTIQRYRCFVAIILFTLTISPLKAETLTKEQLNQLEINLTGSAEVIKAEYLTRLVNYYRISSPSKAISLANQYPLSTPEYQYPINTLKAEAFIHYGDLKQAQDLININLASKATTVANRYIAKNLMINAQIALLKGELDQALTGYQQLMQNLDNSQTQNEKIALLNQMATVYIAQYKLADAMAILFPIFNHLSFLDDQPELNSIVETRSLILIADILTLLEEYSIAEQLYRISLLKLTKTTDHALTLIARMGIATTTYKLGRQNDATEALRAILANTQSIESLLLQSGIYAKAAAIYIDIANIEQASQWQHKARTLYKIINYPEATLQNEITALRIDIERGEIKNAIALQTQIAPLVDNSRNALTRGTFYQLAAQLNALQGNTSEAEKLTAWSETALASFQNDNNKNQLTIHRNQIYIQALKRQLRDKETLTDSKQRTNLFSTTAIVLLLLMYIPIWFRQQKLKQALMHSTAELHTLNKRFTTLNEAARIDPLTHLYNRSHMDKVIKQEALRHGRNNMPLCIAIIDIDNFKRFNDEYGHYCGDTIAQEIAGELLKHARTHDVLARWANEEFVILMPEIRLEGAKSHAEKLRLMISRLTVSHQATIHNVSVSIGVAMCLPEDDIHEVLSQADESLYKAKKQGPGRVEIHRHKLHI